ncbi:Mothers against decapentaplegic-like protein [Meloidogyne graminicola]|uniref:Mothers against decapentaplegic homolog n=1 Tax=Meloidogyne graminicola TaxID=189291 RepID=A0A8S9ZUE6_9BILA|nr:Mothers against decapentaplegic-like protein [Meloidogyne graminicola]
MCSTCTYFNVLSSGRDDPEFIHKAIESLVKKLKDRREHLDALISAVTSAGKQPSGCVSIHRSLDGRLQVAGRKGIPNVVYARIWRWPNVNKSELVKLPICQTPSNHPDLICINPYHYDRIVSHELTSFKIDPLLPSINQQQQQIPLELNSIQNNNLLISSSSNKQLCPVITHLPSENELINNYYYEQQQKWPSSSNFCNNNFLEPCYNLQSKGGGGGGVQQPKYWCSITYFELDTQVGETFKVPSNIQNVYIDGGMDPNGIENGRFCLGALSNVHRSESSEKARLHIGKGIKLFSNIDKEGEDIYIECLSQKGIFIKSCFLDFKSGLKYGNSAVHKLGFGTIRKVFNLKWAYSEMVEKKKKANIAAMVKAYAVAGIGPTQNGNIQTDLGTGVDDLRETCCTISISFVKGWGIGYPRSNIKETPCWIEIQLFRPLQLLNELLSSN